MKISEQAFTVAAEKGTVRIEIMLWGPVSQERQDREQLIANHRAEQLSVIYSRVW